MNWYLKKDKLIRTINSTNTFFSKRLKEAKLLFLTGVLLFLTTSFSEDDILVRILGSLKKQNDQFPVEKVYVHTDKPYFFSGERIWLKTYLVAGPTHLPSPLSKIVYVDLLTPKNEIIKHLTLFSPAGSANGTIDLPLSLPSGNYTLEGYTKWMQNFSCDYYFRQDIRIWSLLDNPSKEQTEISNPKIDLQFFPEGGNLISGILNKVGFKAINQNGLGVEIKGKVVDHSGKEIVAFQSNRLGMGSFLLTPNLDSEYHAVLDEPYQLVIKLPTAAAQSTGFSIINNPNKGELMVKIRNNHTKLSGSFYLVGQARGVTCYAAKVDLKESYLNTAIDKKKFPTGVSQFTLFDQAGKPIAERLVYIDHQEKSSIKITSDKAIYKPREKVSLSIEVTNEKGEPQLADLSLSICDTQQILIDDNNLNIISFLDLTSDLKGNIESPGYYFNLKNKDRHEALDALMLTQGWRRFNWTDISTDKWPTLKWAPEREFAIRGKLMDNNRSKPIANGKVMLLSGEAAGDIVLATSSTDGSFVLKDVHIYDTAKITLSAANQRGDKSQVKVEIDTLTQSTDCAIDVKSLALSQTLADFEKGIINRVIRQQEIDAAYRMDENTILLQGVDVTATRLERSPSKFFGEGDATIHAEDLQESRSFTHPLQFLQGRVAGVIVSSSSITSYDVTIRGGTPIILVDDVIISNDALGLIPATSIESVVVLKGTSASIFGVRGDGGALLFYTKKGQVDTSKSSEGYVVLTKMGYQVPKEFYSPKYDVVKPEHTKPDERIVLFWCPTIKTNDQGKATIEFYNHDLESSVIGIVQGMTSSGTPLFTSMRYQILK